MSRVKTLDGLYLMNFSPDKVMVDEKVSTFYATLEDVGKVEPINQMSLSFEEDEDVEKISKPEAMNIIVECTKEFNGLYGKSGLRKILAASSSIKQNGYNDKVSGSKYFGALKCYTQKAIGSMIDELMEKGCLIPKKIAYGRPVLLVNSKD